MVGAKLGLVDGYFGTNLAMRRMRTALRDHIVRLANDALDVQLARGELEAASRIEKIGGGLRDQLR